MIEEKPSCVACTTPMAKGHVGDFSQAGILAERWYEVTELKRNLFGAMFVKPDKKTKGLVVSAWRCPLCGRLDFFALDQE